MKLNTTKIFNEIERLGMTIPEFYQKQKWSKQYWHWLINSEPTIKKAEKLAGVLGFDPKELLI